MAVSRPDHAELVWVDSQRIFEQESALKGFASVFAREHSVGLRSRHVQVGDVPRLVVGELVVGGQQRVGFAVSFDLGHFVERLPRGPIPHVRLVEDPPVVLGLEREHDAVGEVAVVGDC